VASVALFTGCGDSDSNNGLIRADAGSPADTGTGGDATPDTGTDDTIIDNDANVTPDTEDGGDAVTPDDTITEPDTGPTVDERFIACTANSECEAGEQCIAGVCIRPPQAAATLYEEIDTPEDDGTVTTTLEDRPDTVLNFDCYSDGSLTATPEGPATATLRGIVERFGSGPATDGLCVSVYREDALLEWLADSECFGVQDDEESFVACFQLDSCRCEAFYANDDDGEIETMIDAANDALAEAGSDLEIDDQDSCFAFIGNCLEIEDADMRATCQSRVQTRGRADGATTLVYGHTISTDNPDGTEFASFEIANLPTNRSFAFKVSGREIRWRDAWEYGLYTRADLVRDGAIRIDTNAVSASTWQTIPPAVGFTRGIDDSNGAVAGAVRDCGVAGERKPYNVQHATAGFAFLTNTTRLAYFNGNPNNQLPDQSRIDSNTDSLFAAINLPPGPNRVSTMACVENCLPGESDPVYVSIGARNVFQTPKSVIIATFEGIQAP
jgi:hypothetical protein